MLYASEIDAIKADLGITQLDIKWVWVDKKVLNQRGCTGEHFGRGIGRHTVRIALLQRGGYAEVVNTIAHELRHAWQFSQEVCEELMLGRYKWAGTTFAPARAGFYTRRQVKYLLRPEEIDARGYAADACKRLFGQQKRPAQTVTGAVAAMFDVAFD